MTKNYDDYAEDEDLPVKPIVRCRIISHEAPEFLIMLVEYDDNAEDHAAGKTTPINLAIHVDAAESIGAALIDSAKTRRKESGIKTGVRKPN